MNWHRIKSGSLGLLIWFPVVSLHMVESGFAEEAKVVGGTRFNLLTEPINALVQIREFRTPYIEPIIIPEGLYHVSVTAPGYLGAHGTVDVRGEDWSGLVRLTPLGKKGVNPQSLGPENPRCEKLLQERNKLKKELTQLQERVKPLDKEPGSPSEIPRSVHDEGKKSPSEAYQTSEESPPSPAPTDLVTHPSPDNVDEGVELVLRHFQKIPAEQRQEAATINKLIDHLTTLAPNDPKVQNMKQLHEQRFIIYIGTFSLDEKAKEIETKLTSLSIPTFRQQFQKEGKNLLRLCAGLFAHRQGAIDTLPVLEREFNIRDAIIRKFGPDSRPNNTPPQGQKTD